MTFYDGLKDFAGPGATVIASTVAGIFAYRQWLTSRLQADIALNKLKFDTFAARHDVPAAAFDLVKYVLSKNIRPDHVEFVRECVNRIEQGRYYFPKHIIAELDLIIIKSQRLEHYYSRGDSAPFLARKSIRDRIDDIENELASRAVDLPRLFEPYLSIDLLSKDKKATFIFANKIVSLYALIALQVVTVIILASMALAVAGR
jgi:hypothetical protein